MKENRKKRLEISRDKRRRKDISSGEERKIMSKQIVKKKILSTDKGIKQILSKGTQRNQSNFHEEIKEGKGKERKGQKNASKHEKN